MSNQSRRLTFSLNCACVAHEFELAKERADFEVAAVRGLRLYRQRQYCWGIQSMAMVVSLKNCFGRLCMCRITSV